MTTCSPSACPAQLSAGRAGASSGGGSRAGSSAVGAGDTGGDGVADGAPASTTGSRELGADVHWHLPSRFEEGYGVSRDTLGRLADKGLVQHHLSAPEPVQGGRARKHFHLTAAGARALAHSTAMLTRMMNGFRPAVAKGRAR